jgi:hypothetical protein
MAYQDSPYRPGQGPTRGVSVTLTEGTWAAARELAGERGLSSMVEEALQHAIDMHNLDLLIAWVEEKTGPADPEQVAEAERILMGHKREYYERLQRESEAAGKGEGAA